MSFNKFFLRKNFLKKRNLYSKSNIIDKSKIIKDKLFEKFNFNNYKIIHTYISYKKEVNTWLIIEKIMNDYSHCNIIVPKCYKYNQLQHFELKNSLLLPNRYGILEPFESRKYNRIDEIDLVIVPLLAFDLDGNRVGYGKGYYDRFLENCENVKKVGICFERPVSKILDTNKYDVKLDYCITPEKIYCFE